MTGRHQRPHWRVLLQEGADTQHIVVLTWQEASEVLRALNTWRDAADLAETYSTGEEAAAGLRFVAESMTSKAPER